LSNPLYIAKYEGKASVKAGCYDLDKKYIIPLPTPPEECFMENYRLPKREQKFRREQYPKNWMTLPEKEREELVARMWHKRKNGVWFLIKGQPVYLTGKNWTYLNFWPTKRGLPEFRMTQVEHFWVWDMVSRDPMVDGLLEFKGRREGATEVFLFLMWELASRVRGVHCGMQSTKTEQAQATYMRLARANQKMVKFFQPSMPDSDLPMNGIRFDYPAIRNTISSIQSGKNENLKIIPALESKITFEATRVGKYDSEELHLFYGDEFWKIPPSTMDVERQFEVLRECLRAGSKLVGKMILASTIEESDEGKISQVDSQKALAISQRMWDGSNPEVRGEDGRTGTGLIRLMRNYTYSADVDEWGFPKIEEKRAEVESRAAFLEKQENFKALIRWRRKYPRDERDALLPSEDECIINPYLVDKRTAQLRNNLNHDGMPFDEKGNPVKPKAIRGNLQWKGGVFGGVVEWDPREDGRWLISQHPVNGNQRFQQDGIWMPANQAFYKMGVDPVGTKTNSRFRSSGGISVFRSRNDKAEVGLIYDEAGQVMNPWAMQTEQFVCTYKYRHDDPRYFYEDCLMTALYYSCMAHIESDVSYVINKFRDDGYLGFVQNKPRELNSGNRRTVGVSGTKASANVIDMYINLLIAHLSGRWQTYHHIDLLEDYRTFNRENRGKHDLTVSAGYALLADMDGRFKPERDDDQEDGFSGLWSVQGSNEINENEGFWN